jgi:hypothetical protein
VYSQKQPTPSEKKEIAEGRPRGGGDPALPVSDRIKIYPLEDFPYRRELPYRGEIPSTPIIIHDNLFSSLFPSLFSDSHHSSMQNFQEALGVLPLYSSPCFSLHPPLYPSWTPLHTACWKGDLDEIVQLVVKGADIHVRDEGGRTLLHIAYWGGSMKVAQFLVDQGIDAGAKDHDGRTPFHILYQYGHPAPTTEEISRYDALQEQWQSSIKKINECLSFAEYILTGFDKKVPPEIFLEIISYTAQWITTHRLRDPVWLAEYTAWVTHPERCGPEKGLVYSFLSCCRELHEYKIGNSGKEITFNNSSLEILETGILEALLKRLDDIMKKCIKMDVGKISQIIEEKEKRERGEEELIR